MKFKQILKLATIGITASALLAACGDEPQSGAAAPTSKDGVTVVKVAYDQASKPMTYLDENGNATGYDVEVMKLVDEALPEYEFDYVGTTSDDLLIGVEQGKYHAGVKNAFWTEERTQKYIFPQEFLGLSSAGLVLKKKMNTLKT